MAEMLYRYCADCAQWRNWAVGKRVGWGGVRVTCDGCKKSKVIADQKALVR